MPSLSPRIDAIQSYRNLLINSAMDFNQRFGSGNATITSGQAYVVDRWNFRAGGGGQNYTVSTSSIVPTNGPFKYSVRMLRNGGSNIAMTQPIEAVDIRPYIGRTMTFSFWVNYSGGSITASLYTPVSGVEDTWQSIIILNDTLYATSVLSSGVTNQWIQLSYTFVVPATAVNGLAVSVQPSSNTGADTINVTGCMLTEGNFVPPYFYRQGNGGVADDFQKCLRYCWVDGAFDAGNGVQHIFAVGKAYATTNGTVFRDFPVHMRIAPSATLTEAFSSYQMINAVDSANPVATGVSFQFISTKGVNITPTVASGLVAGDGTFFTRANGNTTSKIIYSAEL